MRVLWHSCAPWLGTGYAVQTALWTRYLTEQGHDVAISAYYTGDQVIPWDVPVFPPPDDGGPVHGRLREHAETFKPDAIIILADTWIMDFTALRLDPWPVLAWVPVDCDPLSLADTYILTRHPEIRPVAMSNHGLEIMTRAGLTPGYVPHAIDTTVWQPDPFRRELRAAFGIDPSQFAVGMNFNNIDPVRKATPEQWLAFAQFAAKVPGAILFAHTKAQMERSLDLRVLAATLKITDRIRFADQDRVHTERFTETDMIRWYSAMDVVLNATYGEGFGLPAIEAQACGTPVILAENTTGKQLKGPGWSVPTEPFWNMVHGAWWGRPSVTGIKKALGRAYNCKSPFKREACRLFAEQYDIREVGPMWLEILEEL